MDEEMWSISSAEHAEERTSYKDLLKPRYRPALTVGVAFINQMVGVNAVIYYAPSVLSDAGFGDSGAILATTGIGLVNCVVTVPPCSLSTVSDAGPCSSLAPRA